MTAYTFDDVQAAREAGREEGRRERVDLEAEQRAYELIHARALESLGMARQSAAEKGPAWLSMIEEAATAPEWEVGA